MLECFLVFILKNNLKVNLSMCQQENFSCAKEHENILQRNGLRFFFSIIMKIHITTKKCTVNKKKTKNKQKYTNIYETKSVKKHYLNYYIGKGRLGERKSS